jgi:hypothetical protein
MPITDVPPLCITADTLTTVLGRFRRGTAPGLTGWTYEHILDATRRPSARRACFSFLNDMLAGRLPPLPELLDSDGLPLTKPTGGVRLIAIGEAWLRLAALCAVHVCSELGPSLAPLQVGVGIPGGAEGVGHALRSALDAHPDHLLLSLDCKNAFNSVSRQAIFHAAQEHAPFLLNFLSWAYGRPSQVFLRGAPDNSDPVLSTSGVKQGDPLGPLLFAPTLQGPLQRTATAHPERQIMAYFDNINVVSPAAAAAPAFEALA